MMSEPKIELLPPIHTTFETAFEIESYPYSHRLRCKRRVWVEHTKYGQRFVHRTTNPKKRGEVWNTPHKETCGLAVVLYRDLDDEGHIKAAKLHSVWSIEETCKFLDTFGNGLDDEARELVKKELCDLVRRKSQSRKSGYTVTSIDVGHVTREVHEEIIPASITEEQAAALLAKYAPAPKVACVAPTAVEAELSFGPLFGGQ
jgi:hypothetical protein